MIREFFNEWHLGDCLLQCLYFHRVAPLLPEDSFVFFCGYHDQLAEVVGHLPNVELRPIKDRPTTAYDTWIGRNQTYHNSPIKNDYLLFYLEWFKRMSATLRLPNPFMSKLDLWFDYPEVKRSTPKVREFDFLVVNSVPNSGQVQYSASELNALVSALVCVGHSVITTAPSHVAGASCTLDSRMTVTDIGRLSNSCSCHVMVSTGPSWTTFNVANMMTVNTRLLLLSTTYLDYVPRCHHFNYVADVRTLLKAQRLI